MSAASDRRHMDRALALAARGAGRTHPNPMVGAVLVRGGRVVGEGWHRRAGLPHAEAEALAAAGPAARGATLYVSLEPCSHHGRTPPCADAIAAAGVRRVVAACVDPDPRVDGRGLERLRRAGIEVEVGLREERARELNRAFLHWVARSEPYVTLKLASTLDGRIAAPGGQSRWITGEAARRAAHRLRAQADAVLVGVGTVAADDPLLTVRGVGRRRRPLRIVLDPRLRTPIGARLVATAGEAPVLLVVSPRVPAARRRPYEERGVRILALPLREGGFAWADLSAALAGIGVVHLLVEGGGRTAARFLAEDAVQRLELFLAPSLLGAEGTPSVGPLSVPSLEAAPRFRPLRWRRVGEDLHLVAERLGRGVVGTAPSARR